MTVAKLAMVPIPDDWREYLQVAHLYAWNNLASSMNDAIDEPDERVRDYRMARILICDIGCHIGPWESGRKLGIIRLNRVLRYLDQRVVELRATKDAK